MRTLQVGDRPTRLAQALAEFGRIDKTLHTLTYIDDENQRRSTLIQLNRGEGRHRLGRAVFRGKRGELRQRYREGRGIPGNQGNLVRLRYLPIPSCVAPRNTWSLAADFCGQAVSPIKFATFCSIWAEPVSAAAIWDCHCCALTGSGWTKAFANLAGPILSSLA